MTSEVPSPSGLRSVSLPPRASTRVGEANDPGTQRRIGPAVAVVIYRKAQRRIVDIESHVDDGSVRVLHRVCTSSRTSTTGEVIDENADPSRGTTEPGIELAGEVSASNTR